MIRIECPDGTINSTRVTIGGVDVSGWVQSVTWSVDVEGRAATADIRFVLPAIDVSGPVEINDPAAMLDYLHSTDGGS